MLKQLARLSVEADGRYATEQELQFLKDYLGSVDERISAYEKIRDASEQIIDRVETEKKDLNKAENENLFYLGPHDRSETCLRDMRGILRCSAATMLINDLDRMREAVLLWYLTIVRAFNYERDTQIMYQFLKQVVNMHLTPSEAELVSPTFELNCTILK